MLQWVVKEDAQKANRRNHQVYEPNTLCKMSIKYITQFAYVKIDKMNPRLKSDEWFREIMHRRQKVHRMYNLIKCPKMWSFFEEDPEDAKLTPQERKFMDISGCKNLILKEAIFTCDQIQNMHLLDLKLRILEQKLTNHILRDCNKCEYIGEKC